MEHSELKNNITRFIEGLDKKRANGKSIDDIRYDGVPIWWFFKMRFLSGKLPLQSLKHHDIADAIAGKRKIRFPARNQLKAYLFAKSIKYSEDLKMLVSRLNRKQSKTTGEGENIMVIAHTNAIMFNKSGFEVDRIGSVIREIRKDDKLQEYISIVDPIAHNSLLNLLKYENLIYRYMDRKNAMKNASKLHKQWRGMRDKFKYSSGGDREIQAHIQPVLDFVFSKEMIYFTILYYNAYKKIIREKKIRLLLVYADTGIILRCAIMAADGLGIKTLHVSHGIGKISVNAQLPDSVYHAVLSEEYMKGYTDVGIPSRQIFVTGPVFMDDIIKYKKQETHVSKIKKILFLTWLYDDGGMDKTKYSSYIKKYLQELNSVGDVEITIRMHPREKDIELYKSIVKSLGYRNVEVTESTGKKQTKDFLWKTIRDSDLVISFGSTSSVESLIIRTPTFIIDLFDVSSKDPIMAKGIIHVKKGKDISKTAKEMLYDEKMIMKWQRKGDQSVSKHLYEVDGKGGERALGIIKGLISES
ncbi:MAG: UDP-N-acetylglucosamine 2-epimerase [Candidatus Altiarchaeales archaeon]|nr:UDP-N-acetylglucosamine 2-epimerase [Candidatus Altiarchaeales archaeon]